MQIRERHVGTVTVLEVDGRLVVGVEDHLKDKVNSLLLQGYRDILLDLEKVMQLDTTGLSAIIAVRGATEKYGGTIKLVNLPARVHNLLIVTKLITVFDVFDSEVDALNSFGQPQDA